MIMSAEAAYTLSELRVQATRRASLPLSHHWYCYCDKGSGCAWKIC